MIFFILGVIGGVAILAVLVSVMALIIVRQNSKSRTRSASNSGIVYLLTSTARLNYFFCQTNLYVK